MINATKRLKLNKDDLDIGCIAILDLIIDGEKGETSLPGHAFDYAINYRLLNIFLERLAKNDYREMVQAPFIDRLDPNIAPDRSWRGSGLQFMPSFFGLISNLPRECIYSEEVEVFRSVYNDHVACDHDDFFNEFCRNPKAFYLNFNSEFDKYRRFVNYFIHDLHQRLTHPKTRRKILDRKRAVEKNYREFKRYVDKIFAKYSRVNVLRIDLGYLQIFNATSIEELVADVKRMHVNRRHNHLFDHYLGSITKIEYGLKKGVHAHLLLFFDGSKQNPCSDVFFARSIGEYWYKQITKGKGLYWNCNANKQQYQKNNRLGIGAIHYEESEKIENLYRIIRYFCKIEQFVKPKTKLKMKLLRKGILPKQTGPKRGAPRSVQRKKKVSCDIGERKAVVSGNFPQHQFPWPISQEINNCV